jgi:hypothetical protein
MSVRYDRKTESSNYMVRERACSRQIYNRQKREPLDELPETETNQLQQREARGKEHNGPNDGCNEGRHAAAQTHFLPNKPVLT